MTLPAALSSAIELATTDEEDAVVEPTDVVEAAEALPAVVDFDSLRGTVLFTSFVSFFATCSALLFFLVGVDALRACAPGASVAANAAHKQNDLIIPSLPHGLGKRGL